MYREAFAGISSQEVCDIVSQLDDILYETDTYFYLNDDTNKQRYAKSHAVIKSSLKVDFEKLDIAASILAKWGTPEMYIPLMDECSRMSTRNKYYKQRLRG